MFERTLFSSYESIFKVLFTNSINFISSIFKLALYYWFKLKVYLWGKNPCKISSCTKIEAEYAKKGLFKRDFSWQTFLKEDGHVYQRSLATKEKYIAVSQTETKLVKEPDRFLFLGNNAGIISDLGIIYNKELDTVVAETLEHLGNEISYSTQFSHIDYQKSDPIKGVSLSICSLFGNTNYAHFLFDAIPKIYLAKDLLSYTNNILISGAKQPFQSKILDYLNLKQNLIWLEPESHLECEQLLFTSRLNHLSHVSPWGVNAVRKLFLQDDIVNIKKPQKIVFASRKSSSIRKTNLEDVVTANLPDAEIIEFSDLSLSQTIEVCQECSLFIGFHGAAFANLAFCNPGIKVIELQLENSVYKTKYYFYSMAKYLKMDYQILTLSESMSSSDIKSIIDKNIGSLANV